MQTKHQEEMPAADAKISELPASRTFTFVSDWEANGLREELSRSMKEKATELAAKDKEIEILQTCKTKS